MNSPNQLCSFLPVVFACMPMFVSIDSHSEKYIIPHILSPNMLKIVSVCIAENPFLSLPTAPRQFKNRHFLQVIGGVREY